jgi:tryptophan 2,3-dioxygenase
MMNKGDGPGGAVALNYASYLRLDDLLSLQRPLSDGPEDDEMLFIVIHLVNDLWFKQLPYEIKLLQLAMENGHTPIVARTLKRVLTVLKSLVAQIDILETMTPMSFSSFRQLLQATGEFQSLQFRQLEFVLGYRRRSVLDTFEKGSTERARLERLLERPSVYDSFLRYLALLGYPIPSEVLNRDLSRRHRESTAIQESLIEIYRHDSGAWQICELMIDLDEGLLEWRYRHARMVERTVGAVQRTVDGDDGGYLRSTLSKKLFPDLWAIRNAL